LLAQPGLKALAAKRPGFPVAVDDEIGKADAVACVKEPGGRCDIEEDVRFATMMRLAVIAVRTFANTSVGQVRTASKDFLALIASPSVEKETLEGPPPTYMQAANLKCLCPRIL
jgi:hypothetical protein